MLKLPNALQSESFRQTLWALSGNIGYAIAQWGMLISLTRYSSPETVGQYALALAICAPVIMFANMRLRLLLTADSRNDYEFYTYRQVRLATTLFGSIFIIVISYTIFGKSSIFFVVFLIAMSKSIESISDIYYGLFQQHKSLSKLCVSLILKGVISFTLFLLILKYTNNTNYAFLSLSLSWFALLVCYDMPTAKKLLSKTTQYSTERQNTRALQKQWLSKINLQNSSKLIKSAVTLGLVALVGSLFSSVTRYIIGSTLGDAQLGIYAAIAYIGIAGQLIAASFVQPIMPNLAANYKNKNLQGFSKNYRYLLGVALFLGLSGLGFVYLIGEYFLLVVYGEIYSKHHDIFMLAVISSSIGYFILFQRYTLTAMERQKDQLILAILTIALLTAFSLYLTPIYGVSGAIWAEIIALGLHAILGLWVVQKHVKIQLQS